MSNVSSEHKRQQVLALGRLGWPLRRIEEKSGICRQTASAYLKAAGIAVRRVRGQPTVWPPEAQPVAKPATTPEVSTDSTAESVADSAADAVSSGRHARQPRARVNRTAS
jgi:hypothetical protein